MGLNKNQNSGNFNGEVGDMSNYATKSDLSTKVTKEANKSLVDNTLIDKLEDLENYDDSLVREEINSINSQLAHIINEEIVANRYGLETGMDMYEIVQGLLLREDVAKVRVLEGDYTLSNKIIIPEGKQLILTGDNGAVYVYKESDISSTLFTKIKPTFNTGYCFELYDKSSLIGGFVDCSSIQSGGGIYIDFSQKVVHAIRINTVLFGGFNWNIDAIRINGDRPSGTTPGHAYYIDINCGITGFGHGVHLVRLDTQTALTGDANGLAWINGLNINGNFMRCQRYVYFETSHNAHAGGSSYIGCRIQGGSVPNKDIPAVEIGGDDTTLNCQFHDVSANHSQKIRYKINGTNTRVEKEKYSNGNVVDNDYSLTTVYKMPNDVIDITNEEALGGASDLSGWYIREGYMCKIFLRVAIPVCDSWTTIYNLQYPVKKTTRATVLSDRGVIIPVLATNNTLMVINNDTKSEYINLSIEYPILY